MTDVFEEETGRMIEPNERPTTPEELQEAQYIREMQQKCQMKIEIVLIQLLQKKQNPVTKLIQNKKLIH